jgi:hypothetical protein
MGWVFVGCGGGEPAQGEADTPDTDTSADPAAEAPRDADSGLDLDIAGRTEPMTARAKLEIAEGERPVHVAITGLSSGTDFVMIELTFDGLENTIGPHHVQFSLPEGGAHVAIGNLDDTPYYSQGGDIDVSVGADGEISGTFDILLARGAPSDPGQPFVYSVSDDATHLAGSFSGDWELDCHSRLMGHTSFVPGGKYCEQLEF